MKSVSFDFDFTLSLRIVQDFASSLIHRGYDLWVVTSRFPDDSEPKYKINGRWAPIDNSDLFKVTDRLGIKRRQIIFTSHQLKSEVINEMGLEFAFHLDDDWVELNHINKETTTIGVSCFGAGNWKQKCEKILKNEK